MRSQIIQEKSRAGRERDRIRQSKDIGRRDRNGLLPRTFPGRKHGHAPPGCEAGPGWRAPNGTGALKP